jgi:PadR family transcriptional regulator PadR
VLQSKFLPQAPVVHQYLLLSNSNRANILLETNMAKKDVQQGTLALMVLKTLDVLGTLHGYRIARRIEQISGDLLSVNQGTLYPLLLKLEQEGAIASEWGTSENNRRARFYRLTRAGRKQLQAETKDWEQTTALIERFFAAKAEDLQ